MSSREDLKILKRRVSLLIDPVVLKLLEVVVDFHFSVFNAFYPDNFSCPYDFCFSFPQLAGLMMMTVLRRTKEIQLCRIRNCFSFWLR